MRFILESFVKKFVLPSRLVQNILLYPNLKYVIYGVSPKILMQYRHLVLKGLWPNLKNPKTFDEKLIWLNFYWRHPLKTFCGDKYTMRIYVKRRGLGHILVPLLGVYNNPDEINFDKLPEKFVLKCTHGCGFNIMCSDKNVLDIDSSKRKLAKWLKQNIGRLSGELHYSTMRPKIICEIFLEDLEQSSLPIDYKVYCFHGHAHCTMVCLGRDLSFSAKYFAFYDRSWKNRLKYSIKDLPDSQEIKKPMGYDKMIEYAEQLSQPFPFVRVDFYIIKDKPILGEMTFTPSGCVDPDLTDIAQKELGNLINLPAKYLV